MGYERKPFLQQMLSQNSLRVLAGVSNWGDLCCAWCKLISRVLNLHFVSRSKNYADNKQLLENWVKFAYLYFKKWALADSAVNMEAKVSEKKKLMWAKMDNSIMCMTMHFVEAVDTQIGQDFQKVFVQNVAAQLTSHMVKNVYSSIRLQQIVLRFLLQFWDVN